MRNTMKRLAASTMLGLAMLAGGAQHAWAAVYGVYDCTLSAIVITGGGVYGVYDCSLVAIVITAD